MTYFTGAVTIGSHPSEDVTPGKGTVVLSQSTTVSTVAGSHAAVSSSVTLPANSKIVAYYVDTLVAATGTIANLTTTVGSAAGGAQYMTSTDFITTTRGAVALTVAQLAAMANIGSNTDVFITIDANAAATTTQGTLQLTVLYTMA
jgi:hypothetical protein